MPRGGSKKGERRGGRQKGTPNKKTVEKQLIIERAIAESSTPDVPRSKFFAKEMLERFMLEYAALAELYRAPPGEMPKANQALQYERWAGRAIHCAELLAPYQSPTLKAIVVKSGEQPEGPQITRFQLNIFDTKRDLIEQTVVRDAIEIPAITNGSGETE